MVVKRSRMPAVFTIVAASALVFGIAAVDRDMPAPPVASALPSLGAPDIRDQAYERDLRGDARGVSITAPKPL